MRLRSLQTNEEPAGTASVKPVAASGGDAAKAGSQEPYEIVAPGDESSSERRNETPTQRSARERRYEELLRTAPPSPPASTAAKPAAPSLFDRVVTPIASALGITRPRPQPAAPTASASRSQQASYSDSSSNGSQASQSSSTSGDGKTSQEDDGETDLVPPQLMMAEFNPSQVQDGGDTTFSVIVNDNLSGVRSVSGVVTSPSGSLQGFSCTREGDTNRFVARINVPKDAPEGLWLVKYLTLSDNASNSANLNQAQGSLPPSASFRVTSNAPDSAGPVLKSVWLDHPAMRAGEKNIIFVQADDEKSGVLSASGVFVSPGKAARIGFGCRAGANGTWECPISPSTCLDCGVWTLEQIQLQDKANNMSTYRNDNQFVKGVALDIAGDSCDSIAPTMTSMVLNPTVVSNAQASIITVEATLTDEGGCGAASLSAQAMPPGGVGGQRRPVTFMPSTDGTTFIGRLEIPQFAAKGQWTIAWIQALDKGGNLRAYGSNDPVLARATFQVE